MVNRVILIGNLGKDPEIRKLDNGTAVGKFSVATNESYKDKQGEWQTETQWHDIVVWRNLAERAEANLKKGMSVYIEGKLTHRTWQDQDGNNRYSTEVVASYYRIVGKNEWQSNNQQPRQVNSPSAPPVASTANSNGGGDDLPF